MKPTPFEVMQTAKMMYQDQTGHPKNWNGLNYYVPIAVNKLCELSFEIDKIYEEQRKELEK